MKEATISKDAIEEDEVPENPTLVSGDELEELKQKATQSEAEKETVESVKEDLAEELSKEAVLLNKEDCMDMDVETLRSKVDNLNEQKKMNTDPSPRGDPVVAELDEDTQEEIAELESHLEDYQNWGWDEMAEQTKADISDLQ